MPGDGPHGSIMDLEAAASRLPGNHHMLREMAGLLKSESRRCLDLLQSAVEKEDTETASRAAHTLRSAANLFQSVRIVALTQQIEQLLKDDKLDEVRKRLPELEQSVVELRAALTVYLDRPTDAGNSPGTDE